MINIVLVNPEIPPNTGNIIRLCANTGYYLHLIKPIGFDLNDKQLKRAGLDYHDIAKVKIHDNLNEFIKTINPKRILATTSKVSKSYTTIKFNKNDAILFGSESNGLSEDIINKIQKENVFSIPMKPNNRSLNLSNAVSIIVYESWRQHNFEGSV
jgi:tRNA (cytidine/uridine-2'-O-)-methyltransferase|tara:strand:- start:5194 stop:5658 length:465 start_codon:yes stop_codon:yes gene_type:complete